MQRLIIYLLSLLAASACAERYAVVYNDGQVQTGSEILNSYSWSFSTNTPSIGAEPLAAPLDTIRYIREYHRESRLHGPYIRLANGDLLPGLPAGILPADEEAGLDRRLLVQMISPCRSYRSNQSEMVIRLDRVAAIVSSTAAEQALPPSSVGLKDGTSLSFKSARWSDDGLKLLTSDGLKRVPFADIEQFRPKSVDHWQALQEDASVPSPDPQDRLVQFRLINGAILTAKRMNLVEIDREVIGIEPAWAYTGIRIGAKTDVVSRSYRQTDEVPLSMLPATSLEQKSYTGFLWPWQKDRNVRGEELQSGDLRAGHGFGTHSYSEIAIALPPGALTLNTWLGMDHAVGDGGCVQCTIYGDEKKGAPLWQSDFLRGGHAPIRIADLDISKNQALVLVTDYAHEKRPPGADPLDIRDEVNWMHPIIKLGETPQVETRDRHARVMDALPLWEGGEALLENPLKGSCVLTWWGHWGHGLILDIPEPISLKRTVTINTTNAWFQVLATRGRAGKGGHEILLNINNTLHEPRGFIATVEEQKVRQWENLRTDKKVAGFLYPQDWDLGKFLGQEIDMELVIQPIPEQVKEEQPLLQLEDIHFRTAIRGAEDEYDLPITPEVLLEDQQPTHVDLVLDGLNLQTGKLANGKPLTMFGITFESGYGVPEGSSLQYTLDPRWKRFVAIIGYTRENWIDVGPYQVLIDDEPAYTSPRYGWWSRSQQIDVVIPEGSKEITLNIDQGTAWGAWAQAGFMTTPLPPKPTEEEEPTP